MLSLNLVMPPLTPSIEVAEEADRVLDDLADDARGLHEDVAEHGGELADRVDDGLDGADRLVDEPLVLGLQLLDAVVEALACLDVLGGEACRRGRPACR